MPDPGMTFPGFFGGPPQITVRTSGSHPVAPGRGSVTDRDRTRVANYIATCAGRSHDRGTGVRTAEPRVVRYGGRKRERES